MTSSESEPSKLETPDVTFGHLRDDDPDWLDRNTARRVYLTQPFDHFPDIECRKVTLFELDDLHVPPFIIMLSELRVSPHRRWIRFIGGCDVEARSFIAAFGGSSFHSAYKYEIRELIRHRFHMDRKSLEKFLDYRREMDFDENNWLKGYQGKPPEQEDRNDTSS